MGKVSWYVLTCAGALSLARGRCITDLLVARLNPNDFSGGEMLNETVRQAFERFLTSFRDRDGDEQQPVKVRFALEQMELLEGAKEPGLVTLNGYSDTPVRQAIGACGVALATSYFERSESKCRVMQTVYMNAGPENDASTVYTKTVDKSCFDVRSEFWGSKSVKRGTKSKRSRSDSLATERDNRKGSRSKSLIVERVTKLAQDEPRSRSKSLPNESEHSQRSSGSRSHPDEQTTSDSILVGTFDGGAVKDEWHHIVSAPTSNNYRYDEYDEHASPKELTDVFKSTLEKLDSNDAAKVKSNIQTALETFDTKDEYSTVETHNQPIDPSPSKRGRKNSGGVVFETSYYKFEDNSCVVEQILYLYSPMVPVRHTEWYQLRGRRPWNLRHIVIDQHLPQCDMAKVRELGKTTRPFRFRPRSLLMYLY